MSTANDMIRRAYRLAGVIGRTDTPSAELYSDGLAALNGLLNDWRLDGIDLGLYALTSSSTITEDYVEAIRYNLALRLSDDSGFDPPFNVMRMANRLRNALRRHEARLDIDSALVSNSVYDIASDR